MTQQETEWLDRTQAAEYLGYKVSTLEGWACTGRREIPYYQRGRKVFYKKADLDAFIESCRQTTACG